MNYLSIINISTMFLLGSSIGFLLAKTLYYRKGIYDTITKIDDMITNNNNNNK